MIAADLTFGSAKGDYCAIQAWGAHGGRRYMLRRFRKRCGFEDQVAELRSFAAEFPRAKIVVEKAANGAAVIETLQKTIAGVVPEVPTGSKAQRLASVAPQVESGACYLPAGAAWVGEYVEELAGASKHDDEADATAYALLALADDRAQPTGRERTAIRSHNLRALIAGRGTPRARLIAGATPERAQDDRRRIAELAAGRGGPVPDDSGSSPASRG